MFGEILLSFTTSRMVNSERTRKKRKKMEIFKEPRGKNFEILIGI
jgi:hypothetical protein